MKKRGKGGKVMYIPLLGALICSLRGHHDFGSKRGRKRFGKGRGERHLYKPRRCRTCRAPGVEEEKIPPGLQVPKGIVVISNPSRN